MQGELRLIIILNNNININILLKIHFKNERSL